MKKQRYVDLYDYTQEEFDRLLESGINKKLRSVGKSRSELDMHTVFAAYKNETRNLPRRRLREKRTTDHFQVINREMNEPGNKPEYQPQRFF